MKRSRLAILAVLAAFVTACGGEPEAAPPPMDAQTAQLLARDVAAVKAAAKRHSRARGERALAELTRDVAHAQAQGRLSAKKARTILAASAKVAEDFEAMPTPRPRRTAPTNPDRLKKDEEHGHGEGEKDRKREEDKKEEEDQEGEED